MIFVRSCKVYKVIGPDGAILALKRIRVSGEEGFELQGVEAISSMDGYSIVMKDGHATLYLNFHNTFQFDSDTQDHAEALLHQIEEIDRNF